MSELTVGVVFTSRPWRAPFQRYIRDHVSGVALRVVRDSRMAAEEHLDVMVVDDETSFLTPQLVATLRERQVMVVGVFDPDDADGHGRVALDRIGVDCAVPATLAPEELLERLEALAPMRGVEDRFEEVVAGLELDEPQPRMGSQVIAVGGPPGAGATEVAIALAAEVSCVGPSILLDVDEVNPGVARRLQLGVHPHLLTALDALRGVGEREGATQAGRIRHALARPATGARAGLSFQVIAGLANRADWQLLRGDEVLGLVEELASRWTSVVVNLGPHLEDLSRYVERYTASRAVVSETDRIVGVCEASPRGLLRFLDWLVDVAELSPERLVDVAVNRAERSPYRQGQLEEQLRANAGPRLRSLTFLAEDQAVSRSAWDGVVVPRSRFTKGVARLAGELMAPVVAAGRA